MVGSGCRRLLEHLLAAAGYGKLRPAGAFWLFTHDFVSSGWAAKAARLLRRSAISVSLRPACRSRSRVFSPSSGARRCTPPGVTVILMGTPAIWIGGSPPRAPRVYLLRAERCARPERDRQDLSGDALHPAPHTRARRQVS